MHKKVFRNCNIEQFKTKFDTHQKLMWLFGESSKMNKTRNKGQAHEGNDILQYDLAEVPEDNSPSITSK